jgi:pSer/pThr/pTyr-binding forkhead associated (FHA) protein
MERGPGGEVAANPRLTTATGDVHLILEGASTIGREAADITISDQQGVSRLHAQITRSGTQITIQDSGSTNGTYINGTKIAAPTVLNPGDTIQFGAAVFRYES